MRVVVTGGGGKSGSCAVAELTSYGHEVTVLDLAPAPATGRNPPPSLASTERTSTETGRLPRKAGSTWVSTATRESGYRGPAVRPPPIAAVRS